MQPDIHACCTQQDVQDLEFRWLRAQDENRHEEFETSESAGALFAKGVTQKAA